MSDQIEVNLVKELFDAKAEFDHCFGKLFGEQPQQVSS